MQVKVVHTIESVDATEWNRIVGTDRLICRHEFLTAVERSRLSDFKHAYVLVYEGDQLIAHASLCALSTELDTFATGFLKRCIGAVRRAWKGFLILRSVECGCPIALGSTITLTDGCDREKTIDLLTAAIEKIAASHKMKVIMFRDFDRQAGPVQDILQRGGYRPLRNLPSARMRIRWQSFEEYLTAMRSQYRCKLLAQRRRLAEVGGVIEVRSSFSDISHTLVRLWHNTYLNAKEYRREVLNKEFFEQIDVGLGARSRVMLVMNGADIAAFLLLLNEGKSLVPLFCGLDYGFSRKSGAYFNMFNEAVKLAIEEECAEIDLGMTTLAPKLDLGGEVEMQYMYMKHMNPLLNRVVPQLFDAMTPTPSLTSRRVFSS
jgi:predicted N-acyltransferase